MSYFIVPPVFDVLGFFREFEARKPRRLDDIGNCEFEKDDCRKTRLYCTTKSNHYLSISCSLILPLP